MAAVCRQPLREGGSWAAIPLPGGCGAARVVYRRAFGLCSRSRGTGNARASSILTTVATQRGIMSGILYCTQAAHHISQHASLSRGWLHAPVVLNMSRVLVP